MAEAKKDLNKLLEHLVDINKELERKIRKLYQQVNLKTEECIKNYSQGNIDEIKEVVALVRKTNSALLDHNKIISDVKKKLDELKKRQATHEAVDCGRSLTMKLNLTDTTCTSAENDHQGNENEKSEINKKENTSLEKRIEHVETELNSVKDTKQKTEDDLSEMKQWKENILENRIKYIEDMISILQKATEKMKEQSVTEKCDMDKQILHVTKKTKKKFKNLQQKMNLQNDTIHELQNKESICLPEINDWRDKSTSEQSDILIKMKQLSDEQKENYLNLKQQCTEDENKIGELSQLIEILMENYAKTCRSLEQVNIDIETVKSNVNEMEKKLKVNTDESDNIARIVASHSELICVLQNVGKEHVASSENQIEQLKTMLATLENDMITRSNELKTIKSRVCNRYACHVALGDHTLVSNGSTISSFGKKAVQKSKTWMEEDEYEDPYSTYIEIHQELDSATLSLLNAASSIMKIKTTQMSRDIRLHYLSQYHKLQQQKNVTSVNQNIKLLNMFHQQQKL
ncbi:early endosome antigen 1-like isoform X2 [Physella acuta]|uniref:early endosome antigen 1-like isoform X2 n=1 Tax=Physella acuta TaxID=109671 RepID=UPI0027DE683A|nr:early endosome antigen 1-like isoform X2 [Physella acuta]